MTTLKDLIDSILFIEVRAEVRYWEDTSVNGVDDDDGTLIPLRDGKLWKPIIRVSDGQILNWPTGTVADIHYKVCDQGEYWLLDESHKRIFKYESDYVPDEYLCHGDNGYGDYIIFNVDENGKIKDFEKPMFIADLWLDVERAG